MQEDPDGMKRQGWIVTTTAVGKGSVSYAANRAGKDGAQLANTTLTTLDERSFLQVVMMGWVPLNCGAGARAVQT